MVSAKVFSLPPLWWSRLTSDGRGDRINR
jgi:hypothetical protein